ncbi:hypothetical protein ACFL11_00495, partial [Patescibacteria group bacterium]
MAQNIIMDQKNKTYLVAILFVITAVFLIMLVIYPLFKDIRETSKNFISQKQELILVREEIYRLKETKDFYMTEQSNLDKITHLFIDPEVPIEFTKFLEKSAINSGLKFEVLSISRESQTEELWPFLSFQISVAG